MGWKQFVRSANAAARRTERAALRRQREIQHEHQRQIKASQHRQAAEEVAQFENYLALLASVHADCGEAWDWQRISMLPPPREPARPGLDSKAAFARAALGSYKPGFFDRLFGQAKQTIAQLESAVRDAEAADQQDYERAMAWYRQATDDWSTNARLAPGVMRLELNACKIALERAGAFEELRAFKTAVSLEAIKHDRATLSCRIEDAEIIPREEIKPTAGGKVSSKDMAVGRYWALYKDHVCSCVLRIAREAFAVLPIASVTVNVQVVRLDPSTGHVGPATILGAQLTRELLGRLSFETINPSAALTSFPHRMNFKKTSGFLTLEPSSEADEQAAALEASARRDPAMLGATLVDLDRGSRLEVVDAPSDPQGEATPDLERDFIAWLTARLAGRRSADFKIKTLVNQLGNYRADRRLSLKAVHDLAEVLATAGYETEPELRDAARSPGIDAWIRVMVKRSAQERRAATYQEAIPRVALLRFLWGAGLRKLCFSAEATRPRFEDSSIANVSDLLKRVQLGPAHELEVLEHLVITGALEHWLREAQDESRLAELASGIRRDDESHKAERWLRAATRGKPELG